MGKQGKVAQTDTELKAMNRQERKTSCTEQALLAWEEHQATCVIAWLPLSHKALRKVF